MSEHYATVFMILLLMFFCVLLLLVIKQRARMKKLEQDIMTLSAVPFEKLEETTPEDDQAYRIIEEERKKLWKSFSSDTEFTVEYVFTLSKDITRKIASVYFPEREEPIYQATVAGLLQLIQRVAERIGGYLNKFPLTFLQDRTVKDMLLIHSSYRKVKESPVAKILGNKFVNLARQFAWGAYNVTNPWYYGRQLVWAVGKEVGIRYLLTLMITIVGEEAVLLYRRAKTRGLN